MEKTKQLVCNICNNPKPLKDFQKDNRCYSGRTQPCAECRREKRQQQTKRNAMSGLCFCGKQRTKNSTQCRFHHNTATKYYRRAIADPQWVEAVKNKGREKAKELKLETFNAYGGPICVCCGEEHIEFLSIDHINGRKDEPKDERKKSGNNLYRWLKNNDYPTGFRVLCMNCNFSRGHAGYCPHERFKAESQ